MYGENRIIEPRFEIVKQTIFSQGLANSQAGAINCRFLFASFYCIWQLSGDYIGVKMTFSSAFK